LARKADKNSTELVTVIWTTYVKYRGERYPAGKETDIQATDYDELVRAGVIQQ